MNGNKIIVHALIKSKDGYLVTKRSKKQHFQNIGIYLVD